MTWEHLMKTDSQLQQDAMAQLAWNPALHAAQIGVEVHDGVVTLAGTVHSWAERELARHAAWGAAGVCSVIDKMTLTA